MTIDRHLEQIADALQKVNDSRLPQKGKDREGKCYLVIDKGIVTTTTDKNKKSSMKELSSFIATVAGRSLSERATADESPRILREIGRNFEQITNNYKKSATSLISRLFQWLFHLGTYHSIFRANQALARIPAPRRVDEKKRLPELKVDDLAALGPDELTGDKLTRVFAGHFRLGSFEISKAALAFLENLFSDLLHEGADRVEAKEMTPQQIVDSLLPRMRQLITKKNHETVTVNPAEFRDLVGSKVKDGSGKIQTSIPMSAVRALIAEYDAGRWTNPEDERSFSYDNIDASLMKKAEEQLTAILENPQFLNALRRYFIALT